jgi:hypothetical protein
MKILLFFIYLTLLSPVNPITWKDVMTDFGKKINYTRFSTKVIWIRNNYQDNIFDSTIAVSQNSKRIAWSKINSVMGKCDYSAIKDTGAANCFFIYSDKAYQKFWVKYDSNNKIAVIKIIRPKVSEHLIPPSCGY